MACQGTRKQQSGLQFNRQGPNLQTYLTEDIAGNDCDLFVPVEDMNY